jgi:hypothetical protein
MGAAAIFAFLGAQGSPIFSLFAGVISTVGELDLSLCCYVVVQLFYLKKSIIVVLLWCLRLFFTKQQLTLYVLYL